MLQIFCLSKDKNTTALYDFLKRNHLNVCVVEYFDYENLTELLKSTSNLGDVFVLGEIEKLQQVFLSLADLTNNDYFIDVSINYYDTNSTINEGVISDFTQTEAKQTSIFNETYKSSDKEISFLSCKLENTQLYGVENTFADVSKFCCYLQNEYLAKTAPKVVQLNVFKTYGLSKIDVENKLATLKREYCDFSVFDNGCLDVKIFVYFFEGIQFCLIEDTLKKIYSLFKDEIYADFDTTLAETVVHLAKLSKIKLSFAESLTGGMVASAIVDVPNASNVLDMSFVTYSNDAKRDLLKVSQSDLQDFSAVSHQVAYDMAVGLLDLSNADVVACTTGIAGPSGGDLTKPVGLVYTALGTKNKIDIYKNIFDGDRMDVRKNTVNFVLFNLIKTIKRF